MTKCIFCGEEYESSVFRPACVHCGAPEEEAIPKRTRAIETVSEKLFTTFNGHKPDGKTNIIDISYWQDPALIDYDKLASEIDGAILRCAYSTYKDTRFEKHYQELSKRYVPLGVYHYIIGGVSANQQAQTLKDATEGLALPLGYWCDVEDIRPETALNKAQVDAYITYAEAKLGKQVDIYTSKSRWIQIMQNAKNHSHRRLWIAHYTSASEPWIPDAWNTWYLWQFTDRARFDGYTRGGLDCSRYNGSELEWWEALGAEEQPTQPPAEDPQPSTDALERLALAKEKAAELLEILTLE